jgi:hypothetical protein
MVTLYKVVVAMPVECLQAKAWREKTNDEINEELRVPKNELDTPTITIPSTPITAKIYTAGLHHSYTVF